MSKTVWTLMTTLVLALSLLMGTVVLADDAIDDPLAGPAIDKDTVVICTADETPSLTTTGHNAVAGDYVNRLTHCGLMRYDFDLKPVPDLAKEYKVEKDEDGEETIWIFTLYDDLKFCDGSDLTADDVVASLLAAKESPDCAVYTESFDKVEAIDKTHVKIHTPGPSASLLYDLAHHSNFINPKKMLDEKEDLNANPVGAGAYKFVKWNRGESLEFTANEYFHDKDRAAKIKNIIWKIIKEGSSRTLALQAGEVDYIIEFDSTSVDTFEDDKNVVIDNVPSVSHNWLCINNEKEPFGDINVRKAINCAINKEDVVDVALNGYGVVAKGQTPEGQLGFSDKGTDDYVYDMEKAQEFLDKWGGDPSSIELKIICSNDMKRRAAEVIQANLAELGIDAQIDSMDLATYLDVTAKGDFTGFIGGFTSNEMLSFLKGVFLSTSIGSANKTRTNEKELDELILKALKCTDQKELEETLQKASEFLNKLCPQIVLFQDSMLRAKKANLDNANVNAGGEIFVNEWSWK